MKMIYMVCTCRDIPRGGMQSRAVGGILGEKENTMSRLTEEQKQKIKDYAKSKGPLPEVPDWMQVAANRIHCAYNDGHWKHEEITEEIIGRWIFLFSPDAPGLSPEDLEFMRSL